LSATSRDGENFPEEVGKKPGREKSEEGGGGHHSSHGETPVGKNSSFQNDLKSASKRTRS